MKTGTEEHLKFKQLKKLLGKPQYVAMGVLESLWHMACRNADEGDIGKYDNVQIADGMEWDGDPDELISALVDSGFIDRVEDERRLVIHDWEEHCPEFVKKRIRRKRQTTVESGSQRQPTAANGSQRSQTGANGAITQPNPTQPDPTKPNNTQSGDCVPADLNSLIDAWNSVPTLTQVRKRDSKSILNGWNKVQNSSEVGDSFEDVNTLMARIRGSTGIHKKKWFKFDWLFRQGQLGEWNVIKVLEGRYDDGGNRNRGAAKINDDTSRESLKLLE